MNQRWLHTLHVKLDRWVLCKFVAFDVLSFDVLIEQKQTGAMECSHQAYQSRVLLYRPKMMLRHYSYVNQSLLVTFGCVEVFLWDLVFVKHIAACTLRLCRLDGLVTSARSCRICLKLIGFLWLQRTFNPYAVELAFLWQTVGIWMEASLHTYSMERDYVWSLSLAVCILSFGFLAYVCTARSEM